MQRRGDGRSPSKPRSVSSCHRLTVSHARYWAVNATTLQPDPTVTDAEVNIGFGGLNGPLTYLADVGVLLPLHSTGIRSYVDRCVATFDALLAVEQRRRLFDEYGIWTQFDTFRGGCASGPSYGHGYALQAMLLMDKLQDAGLAIAFLANVTCATRPLSHHWFL